MPLEPLDLAPISDSIQDSKSTHPFLPLSQSPQRLSRLPRKSSLACSRLVLLIVPPIIFLYWLVNPFNVGVTQWKGPTFQNITPHEISPPKQSPSDCNKTMLIKMLDTRGVFSELGIYARFAALAKSKGYTVFVDDSGWNCGKLKDYFHYEPPACTQDPSILNINREPYQQGDQLVNNPHVIIDPESHLVVDDYLQSQIDPQVLQDQDVWTYLNMQIRPATLPFGQTLHPGLKNMFVSQSNELRALWKLNPEVEKIVSELNRTMQPLLQRRLGTGPRRPFKVIGVHYRLGDKVFELGSDSMGSELTGIETAFGQPKRYFEKVAALAGLHGWELSPDTTKVVVLSDYLPKAMKSMKSVSDLYLDQKPFDLLALNDSISVELTGHDQPSFNKQPLDKRIKEVRNFLAGIEWIRRNSDGIVCSTVSNVCSGLLLLAGVERVLHQKDHPATVVSVDRRWSPRAIPPHDAIDMDDDSFPRLAKELLAVSNNTVDFHLPGASDNK